MGKFFLFIIIFIPFHGFSQIWRESFDGLPDGTKNYDGAIKWSSVQPAGPAKIFEKRTYPGYQIFAINDTGNEGMWQSEDIDISAAQEVAIGITLGSYWASSTDYVRCYYKLDGGPEVLFGEQFGAANLNIASAASAIVTGKTLRIIIRGKENTPGTYNGYPTLMGFDDVTVSRITYLYSRGSGNWDNTNSWSKTGYDGNSCSCTPDVNTHVFIGNGKVINLNSTARSAGVTVEGTGRINYTANARLNIERGGVLEIQNGGVIDKNGNGAASLGLSTYSYNVGVEGILSVSEIFINSANVDFRGAGSINVGGNVRISSVVGKSISNGMSGNFTIGNELRFESTSSNMVFTNRGNIIISNRLLLDNKAVNIINHGSIAIGSNGILAGSADDDGNSIENHGTLSFGAVNLNGSDFMLNNSGTINQAGDFLNINNASAFNNLSGGIWNYGGSSSASRLYSSAYNSSFNFSRPGSQNIFIPADGAYHHLSFSGSGVKSAGGDLLVSGDLIISGSSQLDVTASMFSITTGGNWSNLSTHPDSFLERKGKVSFNGSGEQIISAAGGEETFYELEINKSSGSVRQPKASPVQLTVSEKLNLVGGGLDLNGGNLFVTRADVAAISRTAGFIRSEVSTAPYSAVKWSVGNGTGAYVFPFGTSNAAEDYIPFTFNITEAGTGGGLVSLATYGTSRDNLPYPAGVTKLGGAAGADLSDHVADRFWQIDLENFEEKPVSTITFTATAAEVQNSGALRAQRWNAEKGDWDAPLEGQTNPAANAVTVPGVSSFSPWTLAGKDTPLPVELTFFNAAVKNGEVEIEWETAGETNNDYFTVERSQDIYHFQELKMVKGKGNSRTKERYRTYDYIPFAGKSYYRLKQTDFDGTTYYHKAVMVEFPAANGDFVVYPNPFDGNEITVRGFVSDNSGAPTAVEVMNANGRLVFTTQIEANAKKGDITIKFPRALSPGIYLIRIGPAYSSKIIVE